MFGSTLRPRAARLAAAVLLTALLALAARPACAQGRPDYVWLAGGHTGNISGLAYSPDGTTMASSSWDGTIKLWRVADGMLLHTLVGHTGWAYYVAFSPDGTTLASCGRAPDSTVRIWRVSDGAQVRVLSGHSGDVYAVAFSPDGSLLASGGYPDIRLWRTSDYAPLGTLTGHSVAVYSLAFSPDGTMLASSSYDTSVKLWRVSDQSLIRTLTGHGSWVMSVAFSPDGRTLASGSKDHTVRMWNAADGAPIRTLAWHTDSVTCVTFSPDGATLTSTGNDATVRMWRTSDGKQVRSLAAHPGGATAVAYSPDGQRLVTGGQDRTVMEWRSADGMPMRTLTRHIDAVTSVAFSGSGDCLATGSVDQTVRTWGAGDGSPRLAIAGHAAPIRDVAFSPDGATVASCSGFYANNTDPTVRFWATADGTPRTAVLAHSSRVNAVAYSPAGSTIATCSDDAMIRLWRTSDGSPIRDLAGHAGAVRSVRYSPDGQLMASGSDDHTVRIWRASDGVLLRTLTGHTAGVTSVAFSPDGALLLSASTDPERAIRLWRVSDGAPVRSFMGHTAPVSSVAFAPDGAAIASAAGAPENAVRVWNVADGSLVDTYDTDTYLASAVAFSPGGQYLAIVCGDATVGLARNPAFVPLATRVRVDAASGRPGDTVELVAHVDRLPDGAPVPGAAVLFRLGADDMGAAATSASGEARLSIVIPTGPGAGQREIRAAFAGTDLLAGSAGTALLTVSTHPAQVTVAPASGRVDGPVTLSATLTRISDGAHLAGETLRFLVDGAPVGAGVTGAGGAASASTTIPPASGAGVRTITVIHDETATYARAEATGNLTVAACPTALSSPGALAGTMGQTVTLAATLTRSPDGTPLAGRTVQFTVADAAAGSATTGADGRASLAYVIPDAGGPGTRAIAARHTADAAYGGATSAGTLTVSTHPAQVTVAPASGRVDGPVTLSATLTRISDGAPLAGETLRFLVDGAPVGAGVTGAGGAASASTTIPPASGAGVRTITVIHDETATYARAEATGNLTVAACPTALSSPGTLAGRIGQTVTLAVALTRGPDGTPLAGRTVQFTVGGAAAGAATTGSDGRAALAYTIPDGAGPGSRGITAVHAADPAYGGATSAGSMTVTQGTLAFSPYASAAPAGQVVTLRTLVISGGKPVIGRRVQFAVDGVAAGSGVSDASGAALAYPIPASAVPGLHSVTTSFAGDAAYASATRTASSLTVLGNVAFSIYAATGAPGARVALRTLVYSGGKPVSGLTVAFAVDGAAVGKAVSDATGASLGYTIPLAAPVGAHSITVSFTGSASYAAASRTSSALTVAQLQKPVALSLYASAGSPGQTVSLRTLVYSQGAPAIGLQITFAVDGAAVGAAVSDAAGASLTYAIPAAMAAGVHTVTASYAGSAAYAPTTRSEACLTVSVARKTVTFSTYTVSGRPGDTIALRSLVYSAGKPVSGLLVSLAVDGVLAGSATSDASGVSIPYTIPLDMAPGAHNITVTFTGNAEIAPAARTMADLIVL